MSDQQASDDKVGRSVPGKLAVVVHGIDTVPVILEVRADQSGRKMLEEVRDRGLGIDLATASVAVRDAEELIDLDVALSVAARPGDHLYVHRHECRRVHVDVRFAGATKGREFTAQTSVGLVLKWAEREFEIVRDQRGQYRLKLPNANEYLDNDILLGELVTEKPCTLRVDLVRAEQNAGAEEMDSLLSDLNGLAFRRGLANGSWGRACISGTTVTVPLSTGRSVPRWIGLRLDLTGYPHVAPQGIFWDLENDQRLPNDQWPTLPGNNQAFRRDWAGGNGLYIACDRSALVAGQGHPEWANTLTNTNWRPDIGIARYLSVVTDLLHVAAFPNAA